MTKKKAPEDNKQGQGGGRPLIVFDDEQIIQIESLAAVLSQEQIADYFGIARNTFIAICERQPEVLEQYKKGKARAIGTVAKGLLQKARDGDTASAIFYLKTQAGWKETNTVDHQSSDGSMSPPKRVEISFVNAASQATE